MKDKVQNPRFNLAKLMQNQKHQHKKISLHKVMAATTRHLNIHQYQGNSFLKKILPKKTGKYNNIFNFFIFLKHLIL